MSDYKQITSDLIKILENLFNLINKTKEPSSFSCELCITRTCLGQQERDKAMKRYSQAEENMNLKKMFDLLISHH